MANKKVTKIVTSTHFLICIIGLGGHVFQVSHSYFQYTTVSNIKMSLPLSSSSPPSMSACFHLIDVLKLDKLKKMFDINLTRSDDESFSWNASFIKMNQIAAGSILANLTPATEEIFGSIGGCYYRFNYNVHYCDDLGCRVNFTIEKYLHREYVCYKFTPNFFYNHSLRVAEYSLSSDWQGLIYGINFNPVFFNDAETITSYIHENDSLLLYDSLYASQYFYEKGKKGYFGNTTLYPNIRTTYNTIKTTLLEAPYDTDCRDYPSHGSKTQYKLSLINNQTMKTLNKTIPFIPIYDINNRSPLMMPTDLLYNQSFFKSFEQLMKEGDAIEFQETCSAKSVIPSSKMFGREHVSFPVFWPTNVHVLIDTSPSQLCLILSFT